MLSITVAVAKKMADICAKPEASERTKFLLIQHATRNLVRHRREIWAEQRLFRREASIIEAQFPQATMQIDELRQKAKTHRQTELEGVEKVLVGIGHLILLDRDGSFDKIGFDGVCDLIGVNPVHRADIELRSGRQGLAELIYVSRMENSSGPSSERWGEGGPLFEACFAATCDWIRTAPKEDLPDLFGPGSPFEGVRLVQADAEILQ